MSEAHQLYLSSCREAMSGAAKEVAFEHLMQAATLWREAGQHFSAAVAASTAVHAAWGHADRMAEAEYAAVDDFQSAVLQSPPDSPAGLASLHKLRTELSQMLSLFEVVDQRAVKRRIRGLGEELGQRLLDHSAASEERAESYLVTGIRISTDLEGNWWAEFPAHEVDPGIQSMGSPVTFGLPPAFHLFVENEDWYGAHDIIQRHTSAFTSHGLIGWRFVVLANMEPSRVVEYLDRASDAFSLDKSPSQEELLARGGSWSGINEQLWAKYFRARARVSEAIRNPDQAARLIGEAGTILTGTKWGWHSGKVSRFRILVNALAKLVSNPVSLSLDEAHKEYILEARISDEEEFDHLALTFITEAAGALEGFLHDPASELTKNRLASALDALSRVPLIGPELTEAVRPVIGASALGILLGPVRTWMHRSLASITNERTLQAVYLRLLQAGLPRYAQVRHGPVEFGKDLVALLDVKGETILYFYQVKIGDIDKKKWRESSPELEEMFLVPLPKLHLPVSPARTVGVLVCNGHANPFVEPVMDAWFEDQRNAHGRVLEFQHLDRLVEWIVDHRLVNELKLAFAEHGIDVVGGT